MEQIYSKKLKLFLSDSVFSAGTANCIRKRMTHWSCAGREKKALFAQVYKFGYPEVPFARRWILRKRNPLSQYD